MALGTSAVISGATSLLGGIFGMGGAKKRERAAKEEKWRLQGQLHSLEKNRQEIVNPYAMTEDLSDIAKLSNVVGNEYANLGVATQAAEMQIEQTDIALANTLDTLRATGASAGGATALAQAALQSKKGVSATIESQEVANQQLRAQGAMEVNRIKLQEEQRIQNLQISEGQRMQTAEAAGRDYTFRAREEREVAKMDRVAGQLDGAGAKVAQAQTDRTNALTGMVGSLVQIGGAYMGAKAQVEAAKI